MKPITITIDGPAGSGKGTTARLLAQKLSYKYLDSGAMYRALGVYLYEGNIDVEHVTEEHLSGIQIDFSSDNRVQINGVEYEGKIRTVQASIFASKLSAQTLSRYLIISSGRRILESDDYVLEGRDTGTVWAPDAPVKIYLVADAAARAHRRWLELQQKGETITEEEVLTQIRERDNRDMTRTDGPLCKPEGAHEIDTTYLAIDEQVERIYHIIQEKIPNLKL